MLSVYAFLRFLIKYVYLREMCYLYYVIKAIKHKITELLALERKLW
jgi:hypothetical protein